MAQDLKTKVSVILPAYNGEKYLGQAIESMLNQTFNNFELIIINDGSTDSTEEIIKSYNDKRIKYIKTPKNLGLIKSLNIGIKNSQSEYIARMDQDDISFPYRLKKQVEYLDKHPEIIEVGSWAETINEEGKHVGYYKPGCNFILIKYEMLFGNIMMHPSIMMRKDNIAAIGGYDDAAINVEDYDVHLKFLKNGQIAIMPDILIQYRHHPESITSRGHSQKIMYQNTINYILKNISVLIPLKKEDEYLLENAIIGKDSYKDFRLIDLLKSINLLKKITLFFIRTEGGIGEENQLKIMSQYRMRKSLIVTKYLVVKYHKIFGLKNIERINKIKKFIKKLTPHNIFIKWPRIFIRDRIREKMRNSFLRGLLFPKSPIILTDNYGIRFVFYPWEKIPLEKLQTHRFLNAEFKALKKLIHENDLVFDVGANIGLHSTMFGRWVGKNGIVYAFEPVPQTYDFLCETLALNKSRNVRPQNIGLLEKSGVVQMNIFDKAYSGWNSFGCPTFDNISPIGKIDVATDTIDNFCNKNNISKINFMKVDVEGFEKNVFNGAKQMLGNGMIDYLSFEISKIPLKGSGAKAKEIFDILSSFGYKSYKFNSLNDCFDGPFSDSEEFYDNYYASRRDLKTQFQINNNANRR